MPKNINCITIMISLKGNTRHKNSKIDCKQSNKAKTLGTGLSNSRLPASCIYFLCTINNKTVYLRGKTKTIFKIQKEE